MLYPIELGVLTESTLACDPSHRLIRLLYRPKQSRSDRPGTGVEVSGQRPADAGQRQKAGALALSSAGRRKANDSQPPSRDIDAIGPFAAFRDGEPRYERAGESEEKCDDPPARAGVALGAHAGVADVGQDPKGGDAAGTHRNLGIRCGLRRGLLGLRDNRGEGEKRGQPGYRSHGQPPVGYRACDDLIVVCMVVEREAQVFHEFRAAVRWAGGELPINYHFDIVSRTDAMLLPQDAEGKAPSPVGWLCCPNASRPGKNVG
jgi:hypothetical protein